MDTYNLFISHSWSYPNANNNLIGLLRGRGYFSFKDYSVPRDDPIHSAGTDALLLEAIWRHMAPCSAILILAGVYATYSKWIGKEVELAKAASKPIVAIEPWGSKNTSVFVKQAADQVVGWNTESVVSAIRNLAR